MPGYEAETADFERYDAQVLGISVDSVPSHVAFAKSLGGIERYPLLADFHPKGEVSKKYGVWMDEKGMAPAWLKQIDWARFEVTTITQEEVDRLEEPIGEFFATLTKREFLEGVVKRQMLGYPVQTVADYVNAGQLTPVLPIAHQYIDGLDILVPITGFTATLASFGASVYAASRLMCSRRTLTPILKLTRRPLLR